VCRHLARIGPAASLQAVLLAPPHSLLRQSYAPRRQRHGTVNADGFGVGWYAEGRTAPARYRRAVPVWADPSLASFAPAVRSTCLLAAVRSATAGTPQDESACAPFLLGDVLLSHNGSVPGAADLPVTAAGLAEVGSTVDSAFVAALVAQRLHAGEALPAALAAAVRTTSERSPQARLNLLATDGVQLAATTWGDTLSVRVRGTEALLASEPTDDGPGWQDLPDRALVTATLDNLTVESL